MFRAVRSGVVFGLAATLAFGGATLLGLYGLNLLGVLGLGVAAGYSGAQSVRPFSRRRIGRGLVSGAIGGTVVLWGSVALGMLFAAMFEQEAASWLRRVPFTDQLPLVGIAQARVQPWLRSGGLVLGLCLGLVNWTLMLIGSAVGGWMWRG